MFELILKLLFASLVVGGCGSLFVWLKTRYAKFAPLYFSMLGIGLGFYTSLGLLGLLEWLQRYESKTIEQHEAYMFTWAGIVFGGAFIISIIGLLAGLYFGVIYANQAVESKVHKIS